MNRFEELLKEENLKPKYKLSVIEPKTGLKFENLEFTSLTDFNFFLLSDHYDKIVHATDDEIQVVNLETNEIVFSSKADD